MRLNLLLPLVAVGFTISCTSADRPLDLHSPPAKFAVQWLESIEARDHDRAWQQTSLMIRDANEKDEWISALEGFRPLIGDDIEHEVVLAIQSSTLHNLKQRGHYVTIEVLSTHGITQFSDVVVLEKVEGDWEVIGYSGYEK